MGGFANPALVAALRKQTEARIASMNTKTNGGGVVRQPISGPIKNVILPYYDTRRIPDLDKIQAEKAAENEVERGESAADDSGTTGPGSGNGSIGIPSGTPVNVAPEKKGLTGGQLALIAIASYLLFGG